MKWIKNNRWIFAIILAVSLSFGALCVIGNPVSLHLVQKGAESYVASNYPEWDVTKVGYDFITPRYYAHAEKERARFSIYLTGWGEVYFDTYE